MYSSITEGDAEQAAIAAKKQLKADPSCKGLLISVKASCLLS